MANPYQRAAELILNSTHTSAFTGAGISVESGIPPFRGENGLWSKYDPGVLDLERFYAHPESSWKVIKEIFYDFFGDAKPNEAHKVLAKMEQDGLLKEIITQNIDNLHQEAGSKTVHEFHGNSQRISCTKCERKYGPSAEILAELPPQCECGGLLKPDFIFFGEMIPCEPMEKSFRAAEKAEVFLIIGSTGEVYPAAQIPGMAKQNGATIIEVNVSTSQFTGHITDILLPGKASKVMYQLYQTIQSIKNK